VFEDPLQVGGYSTSFINKPQNNSEKSTWRNELNRNQNSRSLNRNTNQNSLQYQQQDPRQQQARLGYPSVN